MTIGEGLLPEFDQEMATTRKVLARLPEDKLSFKPHAKSWNMAALATHLVNITSWGVMTIQTEGFNYEPSQYKEEPLKTTCEALERFDAGVCKLRAALAGATDHDLMKMWTLKVNGAVVFSMPRIEVLRNAVMNHSVHHRAQLGIYLRLTDVPVPSMYGPTADESGT